MNGVTFIITTLNAQRTLKKCLKCLTNQNYPKNKYEVLILDGGSTDNTIEIAKSFFKKLPIKIIKAGFRDNQEARRKIGFEKSKFDYVCILDSDNYLLSRDWISSLVKPLQENLEVVASFTLHYHYDPKQPLFNRYLALIGGTDPIVYYLGKNDRAKWSDKSQSSTYMLIKFDKENFPTLGSNGTIIRKRFIKYKELNSDDFFHTDILFDLLDKGFNTYAVVDRQLLHDTGLSFKDQLLRRYKYMFLHHLKLTDKRRYKIFDSSNSKDRLKLALYIIYSLTLVGPLIESTIGYQKKKDLAWFMHPVYCFIYTFTYGLAVISHAFK